MFIYIFVFVHIVHLWSYYAAYEHECMNDHLEIYMYKFQDG